MKNLRSRIKSYLFDTNLRWSEIHARIQIGVPIKPHMKDEYIETEEKLVKLFRSWIEQLEREIIFPERLPKENDKESELMCAGFNEYRRKLIELIKKKIEEATK